MTAADRPALRVYTRIVAACTFLLLLAGGMVTSTGSGLAVPDWPLSYGQWMPPMEGGVLYEHGHRMIASFVGLLIVIEAIWLARAEERRWVRVLGWTALAGVIAQGLLGGLTVLLRLPDPVSISHAGLAQLVFGLTVAIAVVSSRGWAGSAEEPRPVDGREPPVVLLAASVAALVFLQILLGAVVRHTGAGLAIPDFPLAYGQWVPPLESFPVRIHFAHRVGALIVAATALWTSARILRAHRDIPALARPAGLLAGLVALQIALGGWTVLSYKNPWVTTAHLGVGALLFATALVLTLRAGRVLAPARGPAPAPIETRVDLAEAR
ncbi:MAG TPA: COX15/CtaA family protein [Gemmatimonadota bacterium]|nr:COX15/CtaA family protein [Gemmatimonadota bacterium]